jgi:hypothetical protein
MSLDEGLHSGKVQTTLILKNGSRWLGAFSNFQGHRSPLASGPEKFAAIGQTVPTMHC